MMGFSHRNKDVSEIIVDNQPVLDAVYQAWSNELLTLGIAEGQSLIMNMDKANYQLCSDPRGGSKILYGVWLDDDGERCGLVSVHSTGEIFAEYTLNYQRANDDVVESVSVWGDSGSLMACSRVRPRLDA